MLLFICNQNANICCAFENNNINTFWRVFMKFISSLLAYSSWSDIANDKENIPWAGNWLGSLLNVLSQVMWVVLAIVGAAGAIYAIYVGVKMARSESAEQREENKKRLINIIVAIVVVIVLIIVFNVFVPMVIGAVWDNKDKLVQKSEGASLGTAVNTIRCLIGR